MCGYLFDALSSCFSSLSFSNSNPKPEADHPSALQRAFDATQLTTASLVKKLSPKLFKIVFEYHFDSIVVAPLLWQYVVQDRIKTVELDEDARALLDSSCVFIRTIGRAELSKLGVELIAHDQGMRSTHPALVPNPRNFLQIDAEKEGKQENNVELRPVADSGAMSKCLLRARLIVSLY